jgi:predicted nucleotidyltransferase
VRDLDYVRDCFGLIWLVRGDHHPGHGVRANPVYWPDPSGKRQHQHLGRYRKHVDDTRPHELYVARPETRPDEPPALLPVLPRNQIVECFHPRSETLEFVATEPAGQWRSLYQSLLDIGVPAAAIGILGSRLVGCDRRIDGSLIKDVDFCIYGIEYMRLVRDRITDLRELMGATAISPEHRRYHAHKFGAAFAAEHNDFIAGLSRKWCSLQLAPACQGSGGISSST